MGSLRAWGKSNPLRITSEVPDWIIVWVSCIGPLPMVMRSPTAAMNPNDPTGNIVSLRWTSEVSDVDIMPLAKLAELAVFCGGAGFFRCGLCCGNNPFSLLHAALGRAGLATLAPTMVPTAAAPPAIPIPAPICPAES